MSKNKTLTIKSSRKIGKEVFKEESPKPTPVSESAPKPELKPAVNSNDPRKVGVKEGFKQPSLTDLNYAYTPAQYKELMEVYKKQNPRKYEMKKPELEAKLKVLGG